VNSPYIKQVGGKFHLTCPGTCPRPLDWSVDTERHAENLMRKHVREYHQDLVTVDPSTGNGLVLNLSAAAALVVALNTDRLLAGSPAAEAALDVWEALTGLSGEGALAHAESLAGTGVTASVPPF